MGTFLPDERQDSDFMAFLGSVVSCNEKMLKSLACSLSLQCGGMEAAGKLMGKCLQA